MLTVKTEIAEVQKESQQNDLKHFERQRIGIVCSQEPERNWPEVR